MIARQTIMSLLLAMLVALGVFAWNLQKKDDCDLAGASRATTQVPIGQSGRQVLVVNCSNWLPRQPYGVQAWCLVDACLIVVFAISLAADVVRSRAVRGTFVRR